MRLFRILVICLLIFWWTLAPIDSASADEVIVNLTPETAFVDIPVLVDAETVYSITTQTGARFEVVNNQTVERLAWVDSWIELRQGDLVLRADDDGNHNGQTNYLASKITGTIPAGTYIIRATSYDYVVFQQRPIGTYTVTSNLIVIEPSPSTAPSNQPTPQPQPTESPSPTPTEQSPTPSPSPQPTSEPTPSSSPIPQPSPTPIAQPEPTPQPEPSTTEPTPLPIFTPSTEPTPITETIPEPPVPVEEPPALAEEPPVVAPEPPVVVEEPPFVVEEPPAVEPEPPAVEELPPLTVEEIISFVEDLVADGSLTTADATEILDALMNDGEITSAEVNNLSKTLSADGQFTTTERELVAEALIESAKGEAVTIEAIAEAGITLEDLPPAQPVEVRKDENGNEVVITAEVAVALELLTSAGDIISAIFESPAQLLFAIGNLGADMSPEERKEASETIIAATLVGNIATTTMATAVGGIGYRRQK